MQLKSRLVDVVLVGACALLVQPRSAAITVTDIDPACQVSSSPIRNVGTVREQNTLTRSAVTWNADEQALELVRGAGAIKATALGINDTMFLGCAADFDSDGWEDFVGSNHNEATSYLKVYKNRTFDNPAPDWNDLDAYRTPKFVVPSATVNPTYVVESASAATGIGSMVCADFDNDGKNDFLLMRCQTGTTCVNPGRAAIFRGNGNGTFQPPYQFVTALTQINRLNFKMDLVAATDGFSGYAGFKSFLYPFTVITWKQDY